MIKDMRASVLGRRLRHWGVFLSLLLATAIPARLSATGLQISGQIIDGRNSKPIPDANILLEGTERRNVSDRDGRFSFTDVVPGKYRIMVTHVAYEPYSQNLQVSDQSVELTIKLHARVYISDDIVVTGTRTRYLLKDVPVTTEVVTREEAQQTGAVTVDQALESAVGVNVDNDLSGEGVTLRGIDPTRVLILVDSEKLVGRVNGAIDLSQISLDNVEKIEIVKGVGSTLYGSDAIGGVVNIITRKPKHSLRFSSSADYGSFKSYSQLAEVQMPVGKWDLQVGSRFDRTDGFDLIKDTPHTNGLERSKRFNLDTEVGRQLSRSLNLNISSSFFTERKNWFESEELIGKTYVYSDQEDNQRYSGRVKFFFTPDPSTQLDANVYTTYYDHLWNKFYQGRLWDESKTKDFLSEASVVASHSYAPGHVITMGADWNLQWLESAEIAGGRQDVQTGDVYMQYEWKPLHNLTILPGVRLEQHTTYGSHINASINAMYNPYPKIRLRAFHGGGYRAPSIKELYFRFDHSAAGYVVEGGGDDLQPETSQNTSFSMEYSYGGIGLHRLTYFYNHLDNLIEFNLLGFSDQYWRGIYRYENVFKAYTKGMEWESQIKLNHSLRFSLSYTWLIAKNLETGEWLLNRPEHSVKLRLTWRLDKLGLSTTAWGSWYSEKLWTPITEENNFDSDTWAPTRRNINLSVSKDLTDYLQMYGRIENITNDVEPVYGYWPGRAVYIGLKFLTENAKDDE
jgi:outer membrane receptor for ferrienterochelin and colicins